MSYKRTEIFWRKKIYPTEYQRDLNLKYLLKIYIEDVCEIKTDDCFTFDIFQIPLFTKMTIAERYITKSMN